MKLAAPFHQVPFSCKCPDRTLLGLYLPCFQIQAQKLNPGPIYGFNHHLIKTRNPSRHFPLLVSALVGVTERNSHQSTACQPLTIILVTLLHVAFLHLHTWQILSLFQRLFKPHCTKLSATSTPPESTVTSAKPTVTPDHPPTASWAQTPNPNQPHFTVPQPIINHLFALPPTWIRLSTL